MAELTFVLGGEQFTLSKEAVEDALKHTPGDEVRKYFITAHGRKYPVKQALAAAVQRPKTNFISTDATRVLRSLGFDVQRMGDERSTRQDARTESEFFFEEYLRSQGLGFFEFEPSIEGTRSKPDYRLSMSGSPILFEVKEFRPDPAFSKNLTGGAYDPYGPIREKIEAGRKKFKEIEDYPCCLVLYNCGHPLVDLSFTFVLGAMLGNAGFQFPVDTQTGKGEPSKTTSVFHGGGKMFRYCNGEEIAAQNTTISAIVALQHLPLGSRRLSAYIDRIKAAAGGRLAVEEVWSIVEQSRGTERDASLRQLRARVYENPYARLPLTREIFRGPFDERYGGSDGKVGRIFAGDEIVKLEYEESEARDILEGRTRNP